MHPITENFTLNTAFPFARQIATKPENGDWHATPLVEVAQRGWVETGDLDKDLRFDKDRDVRGPVIDRGGAGAQGQGQGPARGRGRQQPFPGQPVRRHCWPISTWASTCSTGWRRTRT